MEEMRTTLCAHACVTALQEMGDGSSVHQVIEADIDELFCRPEARRALYQLGSAVDTKRFMEPSRRVSMSVRIELSGAHINTVDLPPINDGASEVGTSSPLRCAIICTSHPQSPRAAGVTAGPAMSPDVLARTGDSTPFTPCTPCQSNDSVSSTRTRRPSKRIGAISASATRQVLPKKRSRRASAEESSAFDRIVPSDFTTSPQVPLPLRSTPKRLATQVLRPL
eukprot:scaffold151577_cov34-Tisochrysis_lutea.AAC.1